MANPFPVVVIAQLFATSLWFSANSGAADELIRAWSITASDIGTLTNAAQRGFILGTLTFALTDLPDRYPAIHIFAVYATLAALCNGAFAVFADDMALGAPLRFGSCTRSGPWCRHRPASPADPSDIIAAAAGRIPAPARQVRC